VSAQSIHIPSTIDLQHNLAGVSFSSNSFSFDFAPDQPGLGQPGKTAGDVVLTRNDVKNLIGVSLGARDKCIADTFRKAGGLVGKWLCAHPAEHFDLSAADINQLGIPDSLQAFLEGLRLGGYTFQNHKKVETTFGPIVVHVSGADELVEHVQTITDAVLLARDWAHEPANIINPVSLAERASVLAASCGLKCRVLDEKDLEALGAGAVLSVGRGSQTPPRLIVLEYSGTPDSAGKRPAVLIGKALTFDSGGYSLKDTTNIQSMKYDKCGGITVISAMMAAARLKLNHPIIGIISAAENMVSSGAYRPDDILTTMSGKTVEIITTDAEGRLVLADALTYAQQAYAPRLIIDLATLTGGIVTALGRIRAGIMGNDANLISTLISAGDRTHERLWQLPLDDDYFQAIKGDDADLKNSGGREGHAIMGGIFLKQFVADEVPWAHLDIAGMADTPKDTPYAPKGATGFGVRLLLDFLATLD
jgi:leucyl aminopeptidase